MTSHASKGYYFSKKHILDEMLMEIVKNQCCMTVMCDFLNEPYSKFGEIRYNSSVGFFNYFIEKFDVTNYPPNTILRIIATLPDGTVWYDSSKTNNCYHDFKEQSINENHNTRPGFLQALMSESGKGFETIPSSTTCQNYQVRSIIRLGPSITNPIGLIGVGFVFDVVDNICGMPTNNNK